MVIGGDLKTGEPLFVARGAQAESQPRLNSQALRQIRFGSLEEEQRADVQRGQVLLFHLALAASQGHGVAAALEREAQHRSLQIAEKLQLRARHPALAPLVRLPPRKQPVRLEVRRASQLNREFAM